MNKYICLKFFKKIVVKIFLPKSFLGHKKRNGEIFEVSVKLEIMLILYTLFYSKLIFKQKLIFSYKKIEKTYWMDVKKKKIITLCYTKKMNCEFGLDMSNEAGDKNSEASEVPKSEFPVSRERYR